jgi:hypothetical protein
MALFKSKELETEIERLKQENAKLYVLGLKQAKEMKVEVENLLLEIDALKISQQQQSDFLEQEKKKYAQLVETSEGKFKEAQSESELLLLQLHQVQEELESVFLKEQEAQNQIQTLNQTINAAHQDKFNLNEMKVKLEQEKLTLNETIATLMRDKGALSQDKTSLTDERDRLIKMNEEYQHKINNLTQLVDGKSKEVQGKNEQFQKELADAKKMIETLTQEKNKIDHDRNQLNQSITNLNEEKNQALSQCDAQTKLANERQTKIDSMSKLIDGQLKEVQEENELLLLQLHQVQEELEHHFLEHQKLQRENEGLQKRWMRLEERDPQYFDYESIYPVLVDTVSEKPRLDWRTNDVIIEGKVIPQFLFTTFLRDGMPGVEVTTSEGDETENPIGIVPRALVKPNAGKALAEYRNMTTQGWAMLATGIKSVEQFFRSPKKASLNQKLPDFFDLVFWRQSLLPLVADFKSLPAVFRFNEVKLKREQINPDYEHLWLEFEGASFGRYHWPLLEIRFAAANVQPGGFSRHPKIEIPKIGGLKAPFDSWFEESVDDFGPKIELRFDVNKQFFDLDVWSKVSAEDRSMLISLIGTMPFAIKKMEDAGLMIKRPWDNWAILASGAVEILRRIINEAEKLAKEAREAEIEKPLANISTDEVASNKASQNDDLLNQEPLDQNLVESPEKQIDANLNTYKTEKRFAKKRRR